MNINIKYIEKILSDKNNRNKPFDSTNDNILYSELKNSYSSLQDWLEKTGNYTKSKIASFILSLYRWRIAETNNKLRFDKNKSKKLKIMNYEVRDIIFADFGATNYGVEASFEHPAIVLHNGFYFLVVIPGSTGRVSKSDYILNANETENFSHNTGIQIDQIRVIDKSRVIKKTGKKVSVKFMEQVNNKILEKYLFPVKKKMDTLENENRELKNKIKDLENKLEKLNKIENK